MAGPFQLSLKMQKAPALSRACDDPFSWLPLSCADSRSARFAGARNVIKLRFQITVDLQILKTLTLGSLKHTGN